MKKLLVVVILSLIAVAIITLFTGCAIIATPKSKMEAAMKADSRLSYRVECYMGHVTNIVVLTDGPGRFDISLDKYECDGEDRT